MTSKEFVKNKYPKARAERYKRNGPFNESYVLIWSDFQSRSPSRLGEGDTESKAWVDAKEKILRYESQPHSTNQ